MSINPVTITVRLVLSDLTDDELLAVHMAMVLGNAHPQNVLGWEKAQALWDRGPGEPVHEMTQQVVAAVVRERLGA